MKSRRKIPLVTFKGLHRYKVQVEVTIWADSKAIALENLGIGLVYWNEVAEFSRVDGIGEPEGIVQVTVVV